MLVVVTTGGLYHYIGKKPICRCGGMVDTHDSKSCEATHVGSSPTSGTSVLMPKRPLGSFFVIIWICGYLISQLLMNGRNFLKKT